MTSPQSAKAAGQNGDRQRNPEMKGAIQDSEANPRFAETSAVRVLCLGNDLLGDDAFGLIVGRELVQLRPDVEVVNSSASGLHLFDQILDCDRLIVVDTVETGHAEPGTVFVLNEQDLPTSRGDSPHCTGLFDALALGRKLGMTVPSELTVIAVEAADCRTIGGPMDPRVSEAIERVIGVLLPLLSRR